MKKPLYDGIIPSCPKCGSVWVVRNFYMDEPEYKLEIEVRQYKVEIGQWEKRKLPDFHCIECEQDF